MTQVKSPYNFVPLNDKVFFPSWSKYVSWDVPFQNELSGKLKLKIKAETPLFIRGEEEENEQMRTTNSVQISQYRFKKLNNRYCIPGTSIKGELRSVLENLSFGKLNNINDNKYSFRDFGSPENYNKSEFAKSFGGFLFKKSNKYFIKYNTQKPKPDRISHKYIDNVFKTNFVNNYGPSFDERDDKSKAAKHKYEAFKPNDRKIISNDKFEKKCEIDASGNDGMIVFTGQSSKRVNKGSIEKPDWKGKHLEFIFWTPDGGEVEVKETVLKDFFFAYFDHDEKSQSIDWKYWKPKLDKGEEIPVFFKLEKNEHKKAEVKHLGLSMLYKLPYTNRVKDLICPTTEHTNVDLDLVETMFGYIPDEEQKKDIIQSALKGRISIEPALNTNSVIELPMVTRTLGSPKASYYPFYIWQSPNGQHKVSNYRTYMNNREIAGRKRYPVKTTADISSIEPGTTTVSFFPLDKEAEFETTIHYHNLRPVELGALLSAITFHNTEVCHHSLGMAKPLGFGNVKFEIDFKHSDITKEQMLPLMGQFEQLMTNFKADWINSEQIKELLAIAKPVPSSVELTYPVFEPQGVNEFIKIKKDKKALPRYSSFMNVETNIVSLLNKDAFDVKKDSIFKTKDNMQQEVNNYINQKKLVFERLIEQDIIQVDEKIAQKQKEEYRRTEGISLLLKQQDMKKLTSITKTWIRRFYTNEDQHKIKNHEIHAIPEHYKTPFLEHLLKLYRDKPNDRIWKIKQVLKYNDAYKYLKICIGEEKAEEWFGKYINKDLTL